MIDQKDAEIAKQFLGSIIVIRGYGQKAYDAVCRMETENAVLKARVKKLREALELAISELIRIEEIVCPEDSEIIERVLSTIDAIEADGGKDF